MNRTKATNMLRVILTLIVLANYLICVSQETEHRHHSDFLIVKVQSGIKVYITQADTFSIIVKASNNSIHRILTEQINNTLNIRTKGKYRWNQREQRDVYITLPKVLALIAESGGDITSTNQLTGDIMFLRASSGSDIYCNIDTRSVKATAKNGASITLSGTTTNLKANAESGGHVLNKKLNAAYANVTVGAGSVIEVNASKWLSAITNGGDIKYKGTPENKEVTTRKGGDVKRF